MDNYLRRNERDIMLGDELRVSMRTIKARGYVLSLHEVAKFRIRGVFNTIGEASEMTDAYIQDFVNRVHYPENGEIACTEQCIKHKGLNDESNPIIILSVIVFADLYSWNLFAMHNIELYYREGHMLQLLMN